MHAFPISVWGTPDEISFPTRAASVDYTGFTRGHKKRRYLSYRRTNEPFHDVWVFSCGLNKVSRALLASLKTLCGLEVIS